MKESRANYISVFGGALVEPVATLLDRLFATPHPGITDVQTGARENGYAVSTCLLLVVMLESFIARARMITQNTSLRQIRQPLTFLRSAYPQCPFLGDVDELFVIRDAIAHNHIWHAQFATGRKRWMELPSGDHKWQAAVDPDTGTTRRLKLKVQPTMIDRYDVAVVLDKVLATLGFINGQEGGRLGIEGLRGHFLGEEDVDLWHIQSQIRIRLSHS